MGRLTGIAPANISGAVSVATGGTGTTAVPGNGQLHIDNGTGFALAGLSTGANGGVTVTNGAGTITHDTPQDLCTLASHPNAALDDSAKHS